MVMDKRHCHLLLAALRKLNDAVETATAGEDGRSFEVAADEIDALEQALLPEIGLPEHGRLHDAVRVLEIAMVTEAAKRHRWNKSAMARDLGISRVGLQNKLERYGLEGKEK